MAFLLERIISKKQLADVIRQTADIVLVLRFGRETDSACLQLDNILEKTSAPLANMANIYTVDVDSVPEYVQYFDISLIPASIFFFNGQHIKVDWNTPDQTKFIGSFQSKQDFIDVIEVIYRGAMRGKLIVNSPLDERNVPKYELIYKDI